MLTRRIILTGGAIAIADQVAARMIHFRRRRRRDATRWRFARKLTPDQRKAEDLAYARLNTERENRYQAWIRRERQRSVVGAPTLKVFGGFCAVAAAFVGGIVWMVRR